MESVCLASAAEPGGSFEPWFVGRLHDREALRRALPGAMRPRAVGDAALVQAAVEAWGEEALDRIRGEFAFAAWCPTTEWWLCARDAAGVQALVYAETSQGLRIATTPRALLPYLDGEVRLDESRIADFLVQPMELASSVATGFSGVRRLPPGHRLVWRGGRARVDRWWKPSIEPRGAGRTPREAEDMFLSLLRTAVERRVPDDAVVASMLSGGVDSSAVSLIAAQQRGGQAWRTVSLVAADGDACPERPYVEAALATGGIDGRIVKPHEIDAGLATQRALLAGCDDPFVYFVSDVPYLAAHAAAADGVQVLLTGVDGDLLCGASTLVVGELVRSRAWGEHFTLARARGRRAGLASPVGLWRYGIRPVLGRLRPRGLARRGLTRTRHREYAAALAASWIDPDLAARTHVRERYMALHSTLWSRSWTSAAERHLALLQGPMLPNALERYARVASASGVQVAHPLLDRDLLEFCLRQPAAERMRGGWPKSLLRRAVRGVVPDAIRHRTDRDTVSPFFFPAMARALAQTMDEELQDGVALLEGFVQLDRVRALLRTSPEDRTYEQHEALWMSWILMHFVNRFGRAAH